MWILKFLHIFGIYVPLSRIENFSSRPYLTQRPKYFIEKWNMLYWTVRSKGKPVSEWVENLYNILLQISSFPHFVLFDCSIYMRNRLGITLLYLWCIFESKNYENTYYLWKYSSHLSSRCHFIFQPTELAP